MREAGAFEPTTYPSPTPLGGGRLAAGGWLFPGSQWVPIAGSRAMFGRCFVSETLSVGAANGSSGMFAQSLTVLSVGPCVRHHVLLHRQRGPPQVVPVRRFAALSHCCPRASLLGAVLPVCCCTSCLGLRAIEETYNWLTPATSHSGIAALCYMGFLITCYMSPFIVTNCSLDFTNSVLHVVWVWGHLTNAGHEGHFSRGTCVYG